jgi:hypothetical protein
VTRRHTGTLIGICDHPKLRIVRNGCFNSLLVLETELPVAMLVQRLKRSLSQSTIISSTVKHVKKTMSGTLSRRGNEDHHGVEMDEYICSADIGGYTGYLAVGRGSGI